MDVSVPIAIVGYDPRWLFAREAATIRTLLGNRSYRACGLDRCGRN
jgi:GrpB-like predicted nucleotidyltransferase (UPF0157 family)